MSVKCQKQTNCIARVTAPLLDRCNPGGYSWRQAHEYFSHDSGLFGRHGSGPASARGRLRLRQRGTRHVAYRRGDGLLP